MTGRRGKQVTPKLQPEEAVAEIKAFYELGQLVIERANREKIKPSAAAQNTSTEMTVSLDTVRKAHQFARMFNESALNKLFSLCRARGNMPLRVNHVRRALTAGNSSNVSKWLARAAKNGWTAEQLDDQIKRAKGGQRPQAGPRFKEPDNLLETLDQVLQHSDQWLKRYERIWSQERFWPPTIGYGPGDRTVLADRLEETRACLDRVGQASNELGKRLAEIAPGIQRVRRNGRAAVPPVRKARSGSR
jgi:hypothetical protein